MKKFAVFAVIAALLLAGCGAQAAVLASPPPVETPDIDALVTQAVDEAVQDTIGQYETKLQERDAEIEALRTQIEDLAAAIQKDAEDPAPEDEVPPPVESPAPKEETPPPPGFQPDIGEYCTGAGRIHAALVLRWL